jgi:hypothetical protein
MLTDGSNPRAAADLRRRDDQLRQSAVVAQQAAWHELLARFPWTHFVTLTFADPISTAAAHRAFVKYIRMLESCGYGRVEWCFILDRTRRDNIHIHALLIAPAEIAEQRIRAEWKHGHQVDVRVYDPRRGVIGYLVAKLQPTVSDRFEFEWSPSFGRGRRLDRRRRS